MKRNFRKKFRTALALTALLCALGGGIALSPLQVPDAAFGSAEVPEIATRADAFQRDERSVSLYFRMRDEALLAREARSVTLPADKSLEQVLIEALIDGPGPNALDVTGLFIPGTRVVSLSVEGKTLLLTLSHEFLGAPIDAPYDWARVPSWYAEVLLRRRLALYSIVNTITEYSGVSSVQLLVRRRDSDLNGERILRRELFESAAPDMLLGPFTREEKVLVSHHNAADIVLGSWLKKDYARLYRFVANRPTEESFMQEMYAVTRSLTSFLLSPGTVSSDGQSAVVVAQLSFSEPKGPLTIKDYPIRLRLDGGIWKIEHDALLALMEAN